MRTAEKLGLVSVKDYLDEEVLSSIKHEYVGGMVYAMAGTRNAHNLIASNTLGALGIRLRGRPCRAYNSNTKIRVRLPTQVRFYYPDASVICRPNPQDDYFQDWPSAVFEVLSRRTRRIDEGEKKDAFLTIPTLEVYVLIEQGLPRVVAFRRTTAGFVREVYEGLDAVLPLSEMGIELPLADIYEGASLVPELDEDEER